MPTKNCVRRDNGGQLHQGFSAKCFPFDGQKASLGVGQYHPFLAQLLEERLDLDVLKLNDLLLPLIDPARQRDKHYVPGPQNETHGGTVCSIRRIPQHPGQAARNQAAQMQESGEP